MKNHEHIHKMLVIIIVAFSISSCTVTRINHVSSSEHLSKIRTDHFKGERLSCNSRPSRYPDQTLALGKYPGLRKSPPIVGKSHVSPKKKNHAGNFPKNSHPEKKETLIPLIAQKSFKAFMDTPNPQLMHLISQRINETSLPTDNNYHRKQVNNNNDLNKLINGITKVQTIALGHKDLTDDPTSNKSYPPMTVMKSEPQGFSISEGFYYLLILLTGFASFLGMLIAPNLSRKISYWAAMNPVKARSMIGSIQVFTGFAGLYLGIELSEGGTQLSGLSRDILITAFLASALLYPVRKSRLKLLKRTYFRQKIHDLLLFLTGFMLLVCIGNSYSGREIHRSVSEITPNPPNQLINFQKNEITPSGHHATYLYEAMLQEEPEASPKKGLSTGDKIVLTILACIGFTLAGFGIIAASCGLACSGLNGLAILVGFVGGISVIALFYWALKSIYKPKKKSLPADAGIYENS